VAKSVCDGFSVESDLGLPLGFSVGEYVGSIDGVVVGCAVISS